VLNMRNKTSPLFFCLALCARSCVSAKLRFGATAWARHGLAMNGMPRALIAFPMPWHMARAGNAYMSAPPEDCPPPIANLLVSQQSLVAQRRRLLGVLAIGGILLAVNAWAIRDGLTVTIYHGLEREVAAWIHGIGRLGDGSRHHADSAQSAQDDRRGQETRRSIQ
jgi:hypothetical protein